MTININEEDLEIEYYRPNQNVNIQDTACRILHKPTNLTVYSANEIGRLCNKRKALSLLQNTLLVFYGADYE